MGEERLYSILIPVYGVENYLNKCVDSLISQTYQNIEIILVDDGAKDNSPKICDDYASRDPRVKVIHKENGGACSARKLGAKMASGEYIICVDGDDWVSTEYIEQFDKVISHYNPDVVCCGYIQTDEIMEERYTFEIDDGYYDHSKLERIVYPIAIESEHGVIFPPQLWAKALKKEIYLQEQLSVIDSIKIGEDGAVVKPIMTKATSLYILDKCLYYYRVNNESVTRNKSAYDWNGPRYIYKHLQDRIDCKSLDFEEQINRRTARDIYTVVFSQFNKDKKYRDIKKEIKEQLMASDYKEVLKACKYKGLKHRLEVFLLRHHLLLPIYLFHKL